MWKIIFVKSLPLMVNGRLHRAPNEIAAQLNACQKMQGGKHVKVKKRLCQDILHFLADARKLILWSIGTPLTI